MQLVYIDETGSVGRGARNQPHLILVAVVVDEAMVAPLSIRLQQIAMRHLGFVPAGFEFHGNEVWGGRGHWKGMEPADLLAAYEDVIGLLEELDISVIHSTIHKERLNRRYAGAYDESAYRLALQFLLEKLDRWKSRDNLRVLIADEAKQEQLKAIEMVADMQRWAAAGEVPGIQLTSVVDSMHFVQSCHSPGVQLADMVAFVRQRRLRERKEHENAADALERMADVIADHTPTYRMVWP